jgi:glutaminyl-tRNA synthetase
MEINFFFSFKHVDKKLKYKRLTCDQPVGLRYTGYSIAVEKVIKDKDDQVLELIATCNKTSETNKPNGFIQWVADGLECEVRLYEPLFHHEFPEDKDQVPDGWLSDINHDSIRIIKNALVDVSVKGSKTYTKYQFERIGYFSVDPDTIANHVIIKSNFYLLF